MASHNTNVCTQCKIYEGYAYLAIALSAYIHMYIYIHCSAWVDQRCCMQSYMAYTPGSMLLSQGCIFKLQESILLSQECIFSTTREYVAESGVIFSTTREYVGESGVYIFNHKRVCC